MTVRLLPLQRLDGGPLAPYGNAGLSFLMQEKFKILKSEVATSIDAERSAPAVPEPDPRHPLPLPPVRGQDSGDHAAVAVRLILRECDRLHR
jgi:hypothetical protein